MRKTETREFPNMRGGLTREYLDGRSVPQTLAYMDILMGTRADVTVFDPSTGRSREYLNRDIVKAQGIVERHLAKLGYVELR